MPKLTPIDHDPFASEQPARAERKLTRIDFDPFARKYNVDEIVQDAIRIHATDERGNPRYVGNAEKAAMQKYLIPTIAIQSENGDPLGLRGK